MPVQYILLCPGCSVYVPSVMDTAFAFLKVLVQTRAKAHTAIGAVCYRFGLAATSTLETPVREGPGEADLRAFEASEKRRLADARKKGKKAQRRRLRAKLLRMDPPRHYDYRARVGIAASGAALPEGAAPEWSDPLGWARRVEAADGKRLDSRQCRDDVVGIPLELVESGFADLAIARLAAQLAKLHHTPVHWVIHKPHGGGLNWHAHMLYAGRRLSSDGHGFERRRDTAQDKPELIEDHKRLWVETCRECGVEITFALPGQAIEDEVREEFTAEHGRSPTDDDEPAIQLEKRKRWQEHREATTAQHTLTSKALRVERDAVAEEEGLRLDAILQAAGGAPLTPHDRRELGGISSGMEDLDTRQLLALDRVPVTTSARIAKYGRPTPAPSPERPVEPPRPEVAPAVVAPLVASRALPRSQPEATVGVMPSRSVPATEVALVYPNSLERPIPQPSPVHPVEPPRPRTAPIIEVPPVPAHAFVQPQAAGAVRAVASSPAPEREVALIPPNSLERSVPQPRSIHQREPPRPRAAPTVAAPLVPARALPQPPPAGTVRAVLSAELLSRAGLRGRVPVAAQRIMRPPRPVTRVEEALPAPAQDERPIVAAEMIHVAPEPPWRRRLRRLVRRLRQTITEWWPWAPTPPRPDRRIKARVPKHLRRRVRPVPARWRRLDAPEGLPRPTPARRPLLLQHPDWDDFDPVTRTVTRNARFREREARARARTQAAHRPKETPPVATPASAPEQTPTDRPRPKRRGGYDGGIGY